MMRRLALAAAAAAWLLAPGGAMAQYGYGYGSGYGYGGYEQPRRAPAYDPYYGRPAPRQPLDPYGGRRYQQARPAPEPQREFYWPWEERPAPRPQYQPQPYAPPAYVPRRREVEPVRPRRPAPRPAPVIAREAPAKPKPTPTTQVAVFGDSLADLVGQGLDDALADNADVGVVRRAKADSGLVRKDVVDWPKVAGEVLAANPKVAYALVMVGANDRQPLRDGDGSADPLSDRWRDLYRERIDALIRVFTEKKVALVWVGLPPMRSETLTKDMAALNDLYRERVERAGGTYVDIWPGFVDAQNHYAPTGPDVDGRAARLRLADGVHFTPAGYRKAAHFADVAVKRLMEARLAPPSAPVAATPAVEGAPAAAVKAAPIDDAVAIERMIQASLPSLPEPPGLPTLPQKPLSGPVVPLTRTEVSPGGALATGRPRLEGEAGYVLDRTLNRGGAPSPQPGRADDFRWPPG